MREFKKGPSEIDSSHIESKVIHALYEKGIPETQIAATQDTCCERVTLYSQSNFVTGDLQYWQTAIMIYVLPNKKKDRFNLVNIYFGENSIQIKQNV